MKVFVSGANGFVGRALCPKLLSFGREVVPGVRRVCGMPGERIVGDGRSWGEALSGCQCVVHLAGRAHGMEDSERDPLRVFRSVNVEGTMELARRAVEAGVRRFVFMSTVKVHGECTAPGGLFRTEDEPAPENPYAISKWEAEQALSALAAETGLEVVILRPPLVYGPGVKGNFASLIRWIQKGIPLPLGAIRNRRSLVALENLVDLIVLCADREASPRAEGRVFMVSDGEPGSTTDLLRKVARAYGCNARLIPVPAALLRVAARVVGKSAVAERLLGSLVVDDSPVQEILGWRPRVTLEGQLHTMAHAASC
jgi:nucleoside-diphosphate-sugar epimerase